MTSAIATVAVTQVETNLQHGVIETDGTSRITAYVEKPTYTSEISAGMYVFDARIQCYLANDERIDMPDLITRLLANNEVVNRYKIDGYWIDIGTAEAYASALEAVSQNRVHLDDRFPPGYSDIPKNR